MIWKDGSVYDGDWNDGFATGKGTFYNPVTGCAKYGYWRWNCLNGYGTEEYKNLSKYEGYFKNGEKSGHGIMTLSDG